MLYREIKTMQPIYANFDGLDVTFQCALPQDVLDTLKAAKYQAQEMKKEAIAKIGVNQAVVSVAETGSRGGFTYRIDTGFHGETWFIVDSPKRDGWNVKVSVKSLTMALYGYGGVKAKILDFLINDLGAIGARRKNAIGETIETPLERVSRVDYCIDYKTEDFAPIAEAFVAKGRFKKSPLYRANEDKDNNEIVFSGRRVIYFRIGTLPNRQIVLYDKTSDIADKKKFYWWKIWDIKKTEFQCRIWRIEARAGKKELNKWNIRRFSDFENKIGNVMAGILQDIRYTIPSDTDANITRWPMAPFWQEAVNIARDKLQNHISDAKRKMIIEGHRRELMSQFEKMILGCTVSYGALHGMDISEIPRVLDILGETIIANIKNNPEKYGKKHEDSTDKYAELQN